MSALPSTSPVPSASGKAGFSVPANMPPFPAFTKTCHTTAYPSISPLSPALSAFGKTVVITGGGRGIGQAIALAFGQARAAHIIITGRTMDTLRSTKALIEREAKAAGHYSSSVYPVCCDVLDHIVMFKVFASFSPIDVLVSNAAILAGVDRFEDYDLLDDAYWKQFEVNIRGGLIATQAFLKFKREGDGTVLINVSSASAHLPCVGLSGYSASKAAMLGFMENLQVEHPEIRVVSIQPGVVAGVVESGLGHGTGGHRRPGRDDSSLPGGFCVWLASPEAEFLKGRFVWANWDVDELKSRAEEIQKNDLLKIKPTGWDTYKGVLPYV